MSTSPLHGGPYQLAYHGHRPRCRKLFDHLQYGVTAKANGLKIYEYLKDLLTEIPKHMADSGLDFQDDLLPPQVGEPAGGMTQTNINTTNGAPVKNRSPINFGSRYEWLGVYIKWKKMFFPILLKSFLHCN